MELHLFAGASVKGSEEQDFILHVLLSCPGFLQIEHGIVFDDNKIILSFKFMMDQSLRGNDVIQTIWSYRCRGLIVEFLDDEIYLRFRLRRDL